MSATAERGTVESLGLEREAEPGAPRLLRELLRRGLQMEAIPAAAALAVELEHLLVEQRERGAAAAS